MDWIDQRSVIFVTWRPARPVSAVTPLCMCAGTELHPSLSWITSGRWRTSCQDTSWGSLRTATGGRNFGSSSQISVFTFTKHFKTTFLWPAYPSWDTVWILQILRIIFRRILFLNFSLKITYISSERKASIHLTGKTNLVFLNKQFRVVISLKMGISWIWFLDGWRC